MRRSWSGGEDPEHEGPTPVTPGGVEPVEADVLGQGGPEAGRDASWLRRRRVPLACTALLLLATAVAVQSQRPHHRSTAPALPTPRYTRVAPGWSTDLQVLGAPALGSGVLYLPGADGRLHALDAADGRQRWASEAVTTEEHGLTTPVLGYGMLYTSGWDHQVSAVDAATGLTRWTLPTGGAVPSAPTVFREALFAADTDGTVYAIDALTGALSWSRPIGSTGYPSTVVGTTLYLTSESGKVFALDTSTGRQTWVYDSGTPLTAAATVADDTVYFAGGGDDQVHALDANTGRPKWSFTAQHRIGTQPAVGSGLVYAGSDDGTLYALDAATGEPRWHYQTGGPIPAAATAVPDDDLVYVGSADHTLYALDARTGALSWSRATGSDLRRPPVPADAALYAVGSDRKLVVLQQRP
ncbi:PQQ-binding-like beta-propeller repeat protein [Streptomyces tateyamensis]|uniref:outer membrane protein assembly factor BamB family protein n=1 Tax=Streptomyces tateyamensis TaxID=565073 RepID=UPI0015E8B470|nr:PQQ-binding-like beta-propeller repeat protein [Streptomyces tateyamensis]